MNKHYKKNGTEVFVNDKKDFEYFIKKFNKKVQKSGIITKVFEKKFYESPSERRKRKVKESISRKRKEEIKEIKFRQKIKNKKLEKLERDEVNLNQRSW